MARVQIDTGDRQLLVDAGAGENLLALLIRAGVAVDAPCGGMHTCKKCMVRVAGAVSGPGEEEDALFRERGLRLACCTVILGDCRVWYEEDASFRVVTSSAPGPVPTGGGLLRDGYGFAVDIGTTTIAAYLLKAGEYAPIDSCGADNRQRTYGADVLSRIMYGAEHGIEPLGRAVREQLAQLFSALCSRNGVPAGAVKLAVVTGNTTMLHFLLDLDARGLSVAPFTPESLFGVEDTLHLPPFGDLRVYCPPCVSAYIGADVVCGAHFAELERRGGNRLFLDVGTNGEMILNAGGRLLACSTAAGPAFEGAGISCGSGAVSGAINHVFVENGEVRVEVLGGGRAKSLCGSGLIDGVAALKTVGILDVKGRLPKTCGGRYPIGSTEVCLTQKDVRELQLAKSALRAGMDTLLAEAGLTYESLDEIILAGGFGSVLSVDSAVEIGLFPAVCRHRVRAVGNAAGAGAMALLLDKNAAEQIEALAKRVELVELSCNPVFARQFIRGMNLGEPAAQKSAGNGIP